MIDDLSGRVALVTGSSRGIGRGIALALARSGASVAVNYHTRAAEAQQTEAAIRALGRDCIAIQADVSLAAEAQRLVAEAAQRLGPVSILVNNAGIARVQTIDETTERDWDDIIAANLKSAFCVTQAALPAMRRQRWGRIVNIASAAAHIGGAVGVHYAASKAGMLGLTHFYASRLSQEGVTVNTVSPGFVQTDMIAGNPLAAASAVPVGRLGQPEDIADIVVALVRNGYITGQTIHVDGGRYMS